MVLKYQKYCIAMESIELFNPQRNGGTPIAAAVAGNEGTVLDKMDAEELPLAVVDAYLEALVCWGFGGLRPETAGHLADMAREKLGEARQALKAWFEQLQGRVGASL
jgi:hypothetical protein